MKNKILFILCYLGLFCGVIAQVPQSEKDALITLYNNTNGSQWLNNSNWNSTQPVSTWFGVTVQNIGGVDHVTNLVLNNNNLYGTLPESISDLTYLTQLWLYNNLGLHGEIPETIGTMTTLESIAFAWNQNMTGNIPQSFQNLSNLTQLYINGNKFEGLLPNLTALPLTSLWIEDNNFEFGDFEAQHTLFNLNINDYLFLGQKTFYENKIYGFDIGDDFSVSTNVSGNYNSYQWYKVIGDEWNPDINNATMIAGATSSTLTITNGQVSDLGYYYCVVTSSIVQGMEIKKEIIEIKQDVPQEEKDALLDLYNAAGGVNWTNNENWNTNAFIGTWNGVVVEDGHVKTLLLNNNNLVGSLPESIQNLYQVESMYFNSNYLTGSLVDVSGMSMLSTFSIHNNSYTFLDLETHFQVIQSNIENFIYAPMHLLENEIIEDLTIGDTYTFTMPNVAGSNVSYQWYKNDDIINGETGLSYTISNAQLSDAANYTCKASSALIPNLTIDRNVIHVYGEVSAAERNALINFYYATGGNTWNTSTNWNTSAPIYEWHGVGVSGHTVTSIQLAGNNLSGVIPNQIDDLQNLEYLRLSFNNITGSIPESLGNLSNLEYFSCYGNQMSGSLPSELGDLINIKNLHLTNNQFSGNIPQELGNLQNLEFLWLDNNAFTGNIPQELGNLQSLKRLRLNNNQLSGTVPSELGNLTTLIDLNLSENQLNGELTSLFSSMEELNFVNLGANNFYGTIDLSQNFQLSQCYVANTNISTLRVNNMNNTNFSLNALNNPNLTCVFVDDVAYSLSNWINTIDASATFVETEAECDALYTYIPDDNFEQALIDLGLDNILDDRVATHQISNLTILNVDNKNISDMTGIEDFVSLTQLICWNNPLSSIDVSNLSNLVEFMVGYGLNSLDVTQNPQLEILYFPSNQLTTLDLSNNPNLRELACTNNLLSILDLSNNPNINYLSLGDNQLSTLDVSHLSQLIFLSLSNNQLTDIDITQNTSLNSFYVDGNSFTNIDVSMLNQLYRFKCQDNDLLQLNVKNGNNNNFILFNAENNPSLNCIVVDDVNYSDSNWLSVDSNVEFVDSESMCESLSIETLSEESILNIYPNPVKDVLNLELKTSNVVQKIVLYDNLGRIVKTFSPTKMALDFRDVPSGIYVLSIQIKNGSLFEKVIKE